MSESSFSHWFIPVFYFPFVSNGTQMALCVHENSCKPDFVQMYITFNRTNIFLFKQVESTYRKVLVLIFYIHSIKTQRMWDLSFSYS